MLKLKWIPFLLLMVGKLALCEPGEDPVYIEFQGLPAPHISNHAGKDGCSICDAQHQRLVAWRENHIDELRAAALRMSQVRHARFYVGCAIEQPFFFDRVKAIHLGHATEYLEFFREALGFPEGSVSLGEYKTAPSPRGNYCVAGVREES